MDKPLFFISIFLHIVSFITAFGSVIVVDTFGLLWLTKKWNVTLELVTKVATVTQKLIWLGYTGLIVTGSYQLYVKGYVDNLTKIKIFFVLMVGLNGLFLHFIKKSMDQMVSQNAVTPKVKFRMGLASTISQTGWWGALLIGFYHRQINHTVNWPSYWWAVIIAILLAVGLASLVGEKLTGGTKA